MTISDRRGCAHGRAPLRGGKSANVILDDLDEAFAKAVTDGAGRCYLNSGQTCSALTRMLVPRDRLALAEEVAGRTADSFTVGDPFAKGTKLGPLASAVSGCGATSRRASTEAPPWSPAAPMPTGPVGWPAACAPASSA